MTVPHLDSRAGRRLAWLGVAAAVIAFTGAWAGGRLVLDGPGASLWVRIALDHWWSGGVPYWIPDLWAGTPAWAVAPTFPVLSILPLAALVGPEVAVRLASVAAQVVGAWGAIVLARSLWRHSAAAVVAGFAYGLHPMLVSHAALAGHQPSLWVMAATPWLIWVIRESLAGRGRRWTVAAGLLTGFTILEQPEHVYGLALMAGLVLVVDLMKAERRRPLLARTLAIGTIAVGVSAYWLFPFLALNKSFVLTPPEVARSSLSQGVGAAVGKDPGLFLHRAQALHGVVGFDRVDFVADGGFYLGWVCVGLTLLTVVLIARRDRDGHLTAILLASVLALWTSTGGVALADGGLAAGSPVVFAVLAVVAGLLVGSLLNRAQSRRVAVAGGLATVALLAGAPYVAPFLGLQEVVPLLRSVRFPRLYPVAILGLALGTAYPVTVVSAWARGRRPDLARLLTAAAVLAVVAAFLADAQPYRSFYRVHPPESAAAYAQARASLDAAGGDFRVAGPLDPADVQGLLGSGRDVTTGWPHPVASRDVWRLTFEALAAGPTGWRDTALGLSGTAYLAGPRLSDFVPGVKADQVVSGISLVRNAQAMPLVRAYDQTLVVNDRDLAPELAVALAPRNIAVVVGDRPSLTGLARTGRALVGADACSGGAAGRPAGDPILSGEVATACAMHRWVGVFDDIRSVGLGQGAGAIVDVPLDGLVAITVWLDRDPSATELVLREVGDDGRTVGKEVARSFAAAVDDTGMVVFPLNRSITKAGKRYAFSLMCGPCPAGRSPRLVHTRADRPAPGIPTSAAPSGNLVVGSTLETTRTAAFSLYYDRFVKVEPSKTTLAATRDGPGRWSVTSDGTQPSLVVVADAWFPGWHARVDGKAAKVVEADGAFVGVPVAAGQHRITLEYRGPGVAVVGRFVSVAAVLISLGFLVPAVRRLRLPRLRRPGLRFRRPPAGLRRRRAPWLRPPVRRAPWGPRR